METIGKYNFFKHSLTEGKGNSFSLMSHYLIWIASHLPKNTDVFPDEYWEKRVESIFDTFGQIMEKDIADIVCTHDIYLRKLMSLQGEDIVNPPTGLLLTNGWFLIFDGHHRVVSQIIRGCKKVKVKYVTAPDELSDEIVSLVNQEENR